MRRLLTFVLLALPAAAFAGTVSLTPSEMEAAKEAGARVHADGSMADSVGVPSVGGPLRDRQIHGEVGVSVGTGGYSAFYGAAVIPIGQSGTVAIALDQENGVRFDRWRGGRGVR